MIRFIGIGGLYRGPPVYGNYHMKAAIWASQVQGYFDLVHQTEASPLNSEQGHATQVFLKAAP